MADKKAIIDIKGLHKTFQSKDMNVQALDNIDLTIHEGDIFGIIGLSGAGKSTLVRCINFLEKPTSGTVIFDGVDLNTLSNKDLNAARRSMGMIFQQFNLLLQRTTVDNICFPLEIAGVKKSEARKRALELLEIVGLPDKAKAYPSQLSGGQKQRIAIARALATNPKVLLCDEATSALDPTTTRSVLELLKDINKRLGITIVIITHEMSVIEEICSHVAIIDNHKIAEVGKVADVFTKPKSEIGHALVFPGGNEGEKKHFLGERRCRVVFEGDVSYEPIIANMILECKAPVNILFGDMREIGDKSYGQMVLQLPQDELVANRLMAYLTDKGMTVEEVISSV